MMPLAPERSTICVPAKPKADFSIDFIVGNANKNNNNNSPPVVRKGASSPLSGRQATPPHFDDRAYGSAASPRSPMGVGSPESSVQDDEEEVRARLLGLQAAAALPGAGALHGLLPTLGNPLGGHLGLPMGLRGGESPPSPPHSPPQQPFMFRSLYRPEPMMVPPQLPPHLPPHLAGHLHHPHHPHHHPGQPPKDSYPLYPWLLSRHGRIFPHRFPGVAGPDFAGFLLHPFRKPKRIRTAFSPSQLLKLEHAFENNHYVVGAERKQVAQALGLSETQVKVWFQNRRTKHKRTEQEEEAKKRSKQPGDSSASSSPSSNNKSSSSSSSQPPASWNEEMDDRCSPSLSHRPVDLSSHDDSSGMESES